MLLFFLGYFEYFCDFQGIMVSTFFGSTKGLVIKEASDHGGKEALSKGSSNKESFPLKGRIVILVLGRMEK